MEQSGPTVEWKDYLRIEPPDGLRFEYEEGRIRTVEFHRRGEVGWVRIEGTSERYQTPHLPDFVLDLRAVWRRLDRKLRRTE